MSKEIQENTHVYCTDCKHFHFNVDFIKMSCKYKNVCYFYNPEDSMPYSERPYYKPLIQRELGNVLFGNNPYAAKYPMIPREPLQDMFVMMLDNIGCDGYGIATGKIPAGLKKNENTGGVYNNVFEVNPYYWGEDEEIADLPNFVYKPLGLRVYWYKYPMRDAWTNYGWTESEIIEEFQKALSDCTESATSDIHWYTTEEKMPKENEPVFAWIDRGDGFCVLRNAMWTKDGWEVLSTDVNYEIRKWRYKISGTKS